MFLSIMFRWPLTNAVPAFPRLGSQDGASAEISSAFRCAAERRRSLTSGCVNNSIHFIGYIASNKATWSLYKSLQPLLGPVDDQSQDGCKSS